MEWTRTDRIRNGVNSRDNKSSDVQKAVQSKDNRRGIEMFLKEKEKDGRKVYMEGKTSKFSKWFDRHINSIITGLLMILVAVIVFCGCDTLICLIIAN